MSTWGLNQADHSSLGWSSFDEIVWTEFGERGDHIVPEPEDLAHAELTSIDDCCKTSYYESPCGLTKLPDQTSQILSNGIQSGEHPQEEDFASFIIGKSCSPVVKLLNPSDEEVWNGFNSASLASVSETETSASKSSILFPDEGGEVTKGIEGVKTEPSSFGFKGICEDDTVYQDNDASIINRSCFFSLSDVHLHEENLDFFEFDHEDANGGSFLEHDWGNSNLEDMDKLFQNSIPFFKQALWSPSSPGIGSSSPGGSFHQISTSSPESNKVERNFEACEMKMELIPCDSPLVLPSQEIESDSGSREQNINEQVKEGVDSKVEQPHKKHVEEPTSVGKCSQEGKPHDVAESQQALKTIIEDSKPFLQEADKIQKAKLHVASHKQLENSKRQVLERKLAPISSGLPQISKSLVGYMPAIPYVHEGFGFPVNQMPIATQSSSLVPQQLQQSPQVLVSYQPFYDASNHQQASRKFLEMPFHPQTGSATMSPQEKFQKLCWRQKTQATLAVEKQQQQLVSHHVLTEKSSTQKQQQNPLQVQLVPKKNQEIAPGLCAPAPDSHFLNDRSLVKNEPAVEKRDDSLEATILKQLQSIMSKLDMRTRLCIRDALYRLAGSAMQRHTIVDSKGNSIRVEPLDGTESSSINYPSSSNRHLADVVETETNPIDRSIAHLLFQKCYFPLEGSLYPPPPNLGIPANNPANYPPNSEAVIIHPSSWIWQTTPSNWGINVPVTAETSIAPSVSNGLAAIDLPGGANALRFLPPQIYNTPRRLGGTVVADLLHQSLD